MAKLVTSVRAARKYEALHGFSPFEAAGLVQLRVAQDTKGLVGVYNAVEAGLDEWGYATVCEAHAHLVIHDTRSLAEYHASDPKGWCGPCRGESEGEAA
jgi:hypothetical protein